jgi:hypothetical protein
VKSVIDGSSVELRDESEAMHQWKGSEIAQQIGLSVVTESGSMEQEGLNSG